VLPAPVLPAPVLPATRSGEPHAADTDVMIPRAKLPKVDAHSGMPLATEPAETARNPIFELLVQNEGDVVGLLAYALYKQNKRDWLIAFQATHGRDPDGGETSAFILGERIPRRCATYRRLAGDMLQRGDAKPGLLVGLMNPPANDVAGQYPMMPGGQQKGLGQQNGSGHKKVLTWRYVGMLLLMLVAMAVLFRLAAAWLFGTPGR
jgi:hypothetical protein